MRTTRLWSVSVSIVSSEFVFQPVHPDTDAPLLEECVTAVREEPNLRLEFDLRDVIDGTLSPWKLPVDEVSKNFLEVVTGARRLVNTVQLAIERAHE